jgi:hypothetical protein
MECFCLGIPIITTTVEMINAIKNDPLIIFYKSGNSSYVVWHVVLPVGCLKEVFDKWMSKAPWTALLESFRRLNVLAGSSQQLTFGNIRVYIKYSLILPESFSTVSLSPDTLCYGIKIRDVDQNIIESVRNSYNLILFSSGDNYYLTHRTGAGVGILKPYIDEWYNLINKDMLLSEINQVLTVNNRKNITALQLRLYGKYQLTYPFVHKIRYYAHN